MTKSPALIKVILLLRSVGLITAIRTLRYTLWKTWLDRKYQSKTTNQEIVSPGILIEAQTVPGGGQFVFTHATLEVKFLAHDLVRISWQPGKPPLPYALAKTEWPDVAIEGIPQNDGYTLSSEAMRVEVQSDGSLTFWSCDGEILRHDLPPQRQGEAWTSISHLRPEEHLYGLGEQSGPLNVRQRNHRLWTRDPGGSYGPNSDPIYMPVPVYIGLHHSGSYLAFYENYSAGTISFETHPSASINTPTSPESENQPGLHGLARFTFEQGMLRYYMISGPPPRALERYTQLTGRAKLPPLWSLGYHQSRWGYKTEGDIRRVMTGFKEHYLPISAIHLDIDYMDGYRVFTVDKERFPHLKRLNEELEQQGIHTVAIIDPGVKKDPLYPVYREGLKEGVFCKLPNGKLVVGLVWPGWSVYPDFTAPHTRAWWSSQYQSLIESGIDGIWHDMNEPTAFTAWGDLTLPNATYHHLEGQGGDHRLAHNLYALLMNRAGYEALRHLRPECRPWLISRSGWAGNQRYAWNWTGDIETSWEGLRMTIATILGMSLSGFPFSGPDIGGFSGTPTAELYTRWFQLATFLPFFRTHSALTTAPREPWAFGEPYTTIIRSFLNLRYQLLPYLYTLAWEHTQTGAPLVRPLFWNDWQNIGLWEVDDAFLLGDLLLVAPVLEEKAKQKEITLPPGRWFNYWNNVQYEGSSQIILKTSLETIPLLVRAGGILPMADKARLSLHIYPTLDQSDPSKPAGLLYSDAGDGYGPYRLDRFYLGGQNEEFEIRWEALEDITTAPDHEIYPFPYTEVEICVHGMSASKVWIDDWETPLTGKRFLTTRFRRLRWRRA